MTRWKMLPLASILFLAGMLGFSGTAGAAPKYEVTVTNLTKGVTFTPIFIAIHKKGVKLFTEGMPASPELEMLAEGGNTAPLQAVLESEGAATTTDTVPAGLIFPGQSVTTVIESKYGFDRISVAGMLLPTNDGFFALNGVKIPRVRRGEAVVLYSPAYDAGTEENDELCVNIPGPYCGGTAGSPPADGDEGFVHIHSGIHGIGDLPASTYDWRNPVAKITIRRVR